MTVEADLSLPLLVAGRDFADDLADRLGDVTDRSVVVDATRLMSGTSSFAAQLVRRVLVDGAARELIVVGAPEEFNGYLQDEATHSDHVGKLQVSREFPVAARRTRS
jgi:hypothetical protein